MAKFVSFVLDDNRKTVLENLIKKNYDFDEVEMVVIPNQGWDSFAFILNKVYFVKFYINFHKSTIRNLTFSLNALLEMKKLAPKNGKVRVADLILNKEGKPFTNMKDKYVVIIFKKIEGTLLLKKMRNYDEEISWFLNWVHKNTQKILNNISKKNIEIVKEDLSNLNDIDLIKKKIQRGYDTMNLHKDLDVFKKNKDRMEVFFKMAEKKIGEKISKNLNELVITHADLHGKNCIIDKKGIIWIVDWDFMVIGHFEKDISFFYDDNFENFIKKHFPSFKFSKELFEKCIYCRFIEEILLVIHRFSFKDYSLATLEFELEDTLKDVDKFIKKK